MCEFYEQVFTRRVDGPWTGSCEIPGAKAKAETTEEKEASSCMELTLKRKPDMKEKKDELCNRPHKVQDVGTARKRIQRFPEHDPRPRKQKVPWRDPYPFREQGE